MSLLIEGKLHTDWFESESEGGEFVRKDSMFRHWITPDGSPGPTGEGAFRPRPGATTFTSPTPAPGRIAR